MILNDWQTIIDNFPDKEYLKTLREKVENEYSQHKIFPKKTEIFTALKRTSFSETKVVIMGQDPYHGEGQAHGLSFSVKQGVAIPPSLKNIFKELEADCGIISQKHGDLTSWAKQGVLLLNASLTVRKREPNSHLYLDWQVFTDYFIKQLSEKRKNLVFLLWGNFAKNKATFIDEKKHKIFTAAHPSPFSAHNGFFKCKHFSKTNQYLESHSIPIIKW